MDLDHIAYTNSANEVDDLDNIAPTISHLRYETEVSCSIQSALALNLETQHEKTSDEDSWKNSDVVCQVIEEVICSSEDVFPAQFSSANIQKAVCETCGKALSALPTYQLDENEQKEKLISISRCKGVTCESCAKFVYHSAVRANALKKELDDWQIEQEEDLRCDICADIFQDSNSLHRHKKTHSRLLPASGDTLQCEKCLLKFASESHLSEHNCLLEEEEKPYCCRVCTMAFSTIKELAKHAVNLHREMQKYECKYCEKKFSSEAHCNSHVTRVHAMGLSVDDVIFPPPQSVTSATRGKKNALLCNVCGKAFKTKEKLELHCKSVHSDEKPFTCPVCLKSFRLNDYLKRHMLMHARSSKGEYVCEFCGKQFRLSNNLTEHRRIHTGERPYRCDLCGLTFTQNSTLRRHIVVHTNDRQYKCEICGKAFARPNQLTIHQRVHTGEKPFECKVCLHKFNQSSQLTRHMNKYHRDHITQRQLLHMQQSQLNNSANGGVYHHIHPGELTLKLDDPLGVATGDGSELGTVVTMSASDVSGSASAAVSGAFVSDDLSKWGDLYLPHADPLDSPLNAADKFL
ncbi:uncharacterized protein LOC142337971 [Convolutriloba macropyga]|uniref:uncharacterized protein LOC142337971 n=1 Tax=Convolutriloba macropyga TaxID=536237 RepID=UPI003F51CD3C